MNKRTIDIENFTHGMNLQDILDEYVHCWEDDDEVYGHREQMKFIQDYQFRLMMLILAEVKKLSEELDHIRREL